LTGSYTQRLKYRNWLNREEVEFAHPLPVLKDFGSYYSVADFRFSSCRKAHVVHSFLRTPIRPHVGMRKLAINKIRVRGRFRKNLGDINSLAASIEEVGLLHPIVVRPDGRLIAGERRLAACKKLGWTSVPVTVVNLNEVIRGGFAENAHRKNFVPSEIDAIRRAILPLENAAAKERQRWHGETAPGRKKHSGQVSRSDGRVRDKIAGFAGISGRTLVKIQAIVGAAEQEPRRFGQLVADMDRHGRISPNADLGGASVIRLLSTNIATYDRACTLESWSLSHWVLALCGCSHLLHYVTSWNLPGVLVADCFQR
jgi:hypothetical protein